MKIAHIVTHAEKNGVATSCQSLISAQLRRGHEILIVHRTNSWLGKQDFDLPCDRIETSLETRPQEIRRVGYLIRDWNPDVIHCHGSRANKYGMVYRIAANANVVTTAHSRKIQIPFAFFKAVIAPSSQTASFHNRVNLVRRSKLHVIPNFTDLDSASATGTVSRAELRSGFGIAEDAFVIGMVGLVNRRKNQVDGLRIVRSLVERHPDVRLLVIGAFAGSDPMPNWSDLMQDPKIRAHTILAGHRDDARTLMRAFDVLLNTSKVEEGSIVILEALARAIPLVGYRTGQVIDLIRNGKDGYAIPVSDWQAAASAIEGLIRDPELAQRIGRQGRDRLKEQCDEEVILDQVDKVYCLVAGERAGYAKDGLRAT